MRLTTAECIKRLADDGEVLTVPGFHKSMKRHAVAQGKDRKWDWAEVLRARKTGADMDKSKVGRGDLSELRRRKLELECKKLDVAIGEAERKLIPLADHDRILSELGQEVRQRLEMLPGSLAPLLTGKPTAIIAELLGGAIREALQQLADKENK